MSIAVVVVYTWMIFTAGVLLFCVLCGTIGDVWNNIAEYERMRSRGYKLMKNDKGEDMWVGYGD